MANLPDDLSNKSSDLRELPVEPEKRDVYSVKRKFDLATMLTGTTGFAIMFACMRMLGAPSGIIGFFAGLIMTVAAAQAILFGGNDPRRASVFGGWAYCIVVMLALAFFSGSIFPSRADRIMFNGCGFVGAIFFGAPVGYIAGALAAGVFLVSDQVRGLLMLVRLSKPSRRGSTAPASPWDDEADASPGE